MSDPHTPDASGEPTQKADRGFQFPGSFEVTAVGNAEAGIERKLPEIIRSQGMHVLDASLRKRASGKGKFVSVSVEFTCPSREKLEALHAALRADDDIHYTH